LPLQNEAEAKVVKAYYAKLAQSEDKKEADEGKKRLGQLEKMKVGKLEQTEAELIASYRQTFLKGAKRKLHIEGARKRLAEKLDSEAKRIEKYEQAKLAIQREIATKKIEHRKVCEEAAGIENVDAKARALKGAEALKTDIEEKLRTIERLEEIHKLNMSGGYYMLLDIESYQDFKELGEGYLKHSAEELERYKASLNGLKLRLLALGQEVSKIPVAPEVREDAEILLE